MSAERDFQQYFEANGWRSEAMTDRGWVHRHEGVLGYIQVDGAGNWWHVGKAKGGDHEISHGRNLESLRGYVDRTLAPKHGVDWSGAQHEQKHSLKHSLKHEVAHER